MGNGRKMVEATFNALFALIDLRALYRKTKPTYEFSDEEKKKAKESIEVIKESVKIIEAELEL